MQSAVRRLERRPDPGAASRADRPHSLGADDRYFDRPRHGDAFSAPPPDLAFGGGGPAPPLAAARPAAFISGGQLRSVLDGGGDGGGAGAGGGGRGGVPQGFHGGQRGSVGGIAGGGAAGQQAAMAMPLPQADAAGGVVCPNSAAARLLVCKGGRVLCAPTAFATSYDGKP